MTKSVPAVDVCVVGLGYIGLPTAAVLARAGLRVVGVDVSASHVEAVNAGRLPFVEAGLGSVVAQVVADGMLSAQAQVPGARAYIVAVPTPFKGQDHEADLSYIEAAARQIAPQLVGDELVVLESTSPPGTTEHMAQVILGQRPDLSVDGDGGRPVVHFAHCPERVLPGRIMVEMVSNDRIIGGLTPRAAQLAVDLYASFCEGELVVTDAATAEMTKLVENSYRDVNIAFANELSVLCEDLGIDVWELISLANRHPRVNILQPGPGVGGHCIAVDPWFIVSALPGRARLIRTAREVNDAKPDLVVAKVTGAVQALQASRTSDDADGGPGGQTGAAGQEAAAGAGVSVACLGLAFKPDIDDLRQSPALAITARLAAGLPGARILAVEPNVDQLPTTLAEAGNVTLAALQDAVREADVVVLLVDHTPFKNLNPALLAGKTLIDTRGTWH